MRASLFYLHYAWEPCVWKLRVMWGVGQKGGGDRGHTCIRSAARVRKHAKHLVACVADLHPRSLPRSQKNQEPPTGEKSAASVPFQHEALLTNLQASTFFFSRFVAGFLFLFETRRDFLHVYKISVSAFTLGSKKKSAKDGEQHSESPCWQLREEEGGIKACYFLRFCLHLQLLPFLLIYKNLFHTWTPDGGKKIKNKCGVITLNEAVPTDGPTMLDNRSENIWNNMEGKPKCFVVLQQFSITLRQNCCSFKWDRVSHLLPTLVRTAPLL